MNIELFFMENKRNIINDLKKLIAIDTSLKENLKNEKNPLGTNVTKGFEVIENICIREKIECKNYNNMILEISIGKGKEEEAFMFLNHIDVVPIYDMENWITNPFELVQKDGFYYGRGANDNKGPLIYILYYLIYIKKYKKTNIKIKLLIGGAEETTWEGVEYYFKYLNKTQPKYGISPDGNFPIVNCEKGIVYFNYQKEIKDKFIESISSPKDRTHNLNNIKIFLKDKSVKTLNTKILKSRSPNSNFNLIKDIIAYDLDSEIISLLSRYFNDNDGSSFNVNQYENVERKSTLNVSSINYNNNILEIEFDFRYIDGLNVKDVKKIFTDELVKDKKTKLKVVKELELLSISENSPLVVNMKKAYKKVMHQEAGVHCKGAASYARILENGLSFGPVFEGEISYSHEANERQSIQGLVKSLKIYNELLIKLGGIDEG